MRGLQAVCVQAGEQLVSGWQAIGKLAGNAWHGEIMGRTRFLYSKHRCTARNLDTTPQAQLKHNPQLQLALDLSLIHI